MASSTISQIGHFLSGDLPFFVATFLLFAIFTLYFGRGRIVSLILAYYPATILFNSLPFINRLLILQDKMLIVNKIAIYFIFLIPLSIVLNNYVSSESTYSGASHLVRTGGFALIALILLIMFSYSTVNYDLFHSFGDSVDHLFTPLSRVFYWNLGIFTLLAFL